MFEYEIYLPAKDPEGQSTEEQVSKLRRALTERFGGVTHFSHPLTGEWKSGRSIYKDEITILRVLTDDSQDMHFSRLKKECEALFSQEEIFISRKKLIRID